MARHAPQRALALLQLGVAALVFVVFVIITRRGFALGGDASVLSIDLILAAYLVYATVGALILVHRPTNTVGWIVEAIGFFPLVGSLAGEYAGRAYVRHETAWPLLASATWLNGWYWYAAIGPLPLLLLLYPDGRPASRRWRIPVGLAVCGFVNLLLVGMLGPSDDKRLPNPYEVHLPFVAKVVTVVLLPVLTLSVLSGLTALALRFRQARGVERQQVTWLLFGSVLGIALVVLNQVIPGDVAFSVGFVLPALAIGFAVLRYRLYDIDRLVSRTVSYSVLTALLALPWVVVVTAASLVPGNNHLAVALATLASAAAFNPLRRRVQDAVDRLFNRPRFDAARTVEAFRNRLRGDIDLRSVEEDLLQVVNQTVQPSNASLWLRGPSPQAVTHRNAL